MRGSRDAFAFPGDGSGRRGALVVHGFTGSPFEVRWLGERLAERGFDVLGPALAGHEHGRPEELDQTVWQDWYRVAERAFDTLRARNEKVAMVGLSMGGLLALHLARERQTQIAAIGAMATPIWFPRRIEGAIRGANAAIRLGLRLPVIGSRLAEQGVPPVPKAGGVSDIADDAGRYENPTMPAMPVRALGSLMDLQRQVRSDLPGVRAPLFLAHSRQDHTAPYACAAGILKKIGSRDVRALSLTRSYHVISLDVERVELARALGEFLEEKLR